MANSTYNGLTGFFKGAYGATTGAVTMGIGLFKVCYGVAESANTAANFLYSAAVEEENSDAFSISKLGSFKFNSNLKEGISKFLEGTSTLLESGVDMITNVTALTVNAGYAVGNVAMNFGEFLTAADEQADDIAYVENPFDESFIVEDFDVPGKLEGELENQEMPLAGCTL